MDKNCHICINYEYHNKNYYNGEEMVTAYSLPLFSKWENGERFIASAHQLTNQLSLGRHFYNEQDFITMCQRLADVTYCNNQVSVNESSTMGDYYNLKFIGMNLDEKINYLSDLDSNHGIFCINIVDNPLNPSHSYDVSYAFTDHIGNQVTAAKYCQAEGIPLVGEVLERVSEIENKAEYMSMGDFNKFFKRDVYESEVAFKFGVENPVYAYIQEGTEGYDYTLYDKNFKDIDGGVLENSMLNINDAVKECIKLSDMEEILSLPCKKIDPDFVLERADESLYVPKMRVQKNPKEVEYSLRNGMRVHAWVNDALNIVWSLKSNEGDLIRCNSRNIPFARADIRECMDDIMLDVFPGDFGLVTQQRQEIEVGSPIIKDEPIDLMSGIPQENIETPTPKINKPFSYF